MTIIRDRISADVYRSWMEAVSTVFIMVPLPFGMLKFAVFVLTI